MGRKYVDVTEIAKHVRKVLKSNFPDVKFSVRSKRYSGGASINVHWTDGPTEIMVKRLVSEYQSVSHIDNTDLVHYKESEIEGEEVFSLADYIFPKRKHSAEHLRRAAQVVCKSHGFDPDALTFTDHEYFTSIEGDIANENVDDIRMPRPMTLAMAIRAYAADLTPQEIAGVGEQVDNRHQYIRVNKDGAVLGRDWMSHEQAEAINAALRDSGWNYQWVEEYPETEAV